MNSHSTITRTFVKTLTYRVLAIVADIIVVFLLTSRLDVALTFAGIMVVISTLLYFAHEHVWAHIIWGKI